MKRDAGVMMNRGTGGRGTGEQGCRWQPRVQVYRGAMMNRGAGGVKMNRGAGVQAVKPERVFTGHLRLYLLFQEGQKAAQRHCIPEMGLTHALNLHLQTTATTQSHELSLDFMNEKQKPKYQKPCTCKPLVLHTIWGCH